MLKYNFLLLVGIVSIFGMDKKQLVYRQKLPEQTQPKKLAQPPKITSIIDKLDENSECTICFELYDRNKKKRIDLKCDKKRPHIKHSFCKKCLGRVVIKE